MARHGMDGDRCMCQWEGCDRVAAVEVLKGEVGRRREHFGSYCVPHSVITSRGLREDDGADVWFAALAADRERAGDAATAGDVYAQPGRTSP